VPWRRYLLTAIEVGDVTLIVVVGVPALFAEQVGPGLLVIGLSCLLLPSALRLLVGGALTTPTLALWPLLLLVGLGLLTVYVTPAWTHTWPELVRLLWGIALCLALINWCRPLHASTAASSSRHLPTRLAWATIVFFALGLALTMVGLLVMGPTHKFAWLDGWLAQLPQLPLPGGNGFNPNRVAGVAVLLAPLALALTLGRLRHHRPTRIEWLTWLLTKPAVAALTLFFSGAVILTQSRTAWVALGCAGLVIVSQLGRRGWLLLLLLAVGGATIVAALGPSRLMSQFIVYDAQQISAEALIQDRNLAGRLILWQRALHGLADAPLTGMGLAAFEVVSQQPYPQVTGYRPDPDMSHVHNIVLQVGVDLGTPGMVAFVSLLVMMGTLLWRLVQRSSRPSPLHTWSLGLLASFVAYLVYSMLDAITLGARPSVMVWFLFGLALGAGEWGKTITKHSRQRRRRTQKGGAMDVITEAPLSATNPTEWEARAWAATAQSQES
jgi:putative inorganic carbon (HCO3(-)) transporter